MTEETNGQVGSNYAEDSDNRREFREGDLTPRDMQEDLKLLFAQKDQLKKFRDRLLLLSRDPNADEGEKARLEQDIISLKQTIRARDAFFDEEEE